MPALTGRDAELELVEGLLGRSDSGEACVLLVQGEPGIGKSRLLRALVESATARGFRLVEARADEWAQDVPFASLAEALEPVVAGEPALVDALDIRERRGLSSVLPGLLADDLAPLQAGERHLAHRALAAVLDELAEDSGSLLVVDDVQWADPATVEVLAGMFRRLPEARVLVAVASRAGQVPPRLAGAVDALERQGRAARVDLGPLSREDAARLLDGPDVADRLDRIYALSGGNPFYLEQLDRTAAGAPASARDSLPVPAVVRDSLAAELAELGPAERLVLECASVVGDPFDIEIVEEVAGQGVLDALDGLLARSLVRPTATPQRFQFRHPLVRAAVYEHAGGGWRIGAHGRAAAALAARGAPAVVSAPHLEHVARTGDLEAIATFTAAAAESMSRSPLSAAHWYDAALRILPTGPGHEAASRDLHLGRALALGNSSRFHETLDELERVLAGLPADDVTTRVALSYECSRIEVLIGHPAAAWRRCRAVLAVLAELGDEPDPFTVKIWQSAGLAAMASGDIAGSRTCGQQALALLEGLDEPVLEVDAHAQLALGYGIEGLDVERGREHLAAATRALDRATDQSLAGDIDAVIVLWFGAFVLQCWEESLAHVDLGLRIAQEQGVPRAVVPLLSGRAESLSWLGRLSEALEASTEALDAVRSNDHPQAIYWTLRSHARVLRWLGRTDEAVQAVEEALAVSAGEPKGFLGDSEPEWTAGLVLLEAGQAQRARGLLETAYGGPDLPQVMPAARTTALEAMVEADLALGDLEPARRHAEQAASLVDGSLLREVSAARCRAAVALATGDPGSAIGAVDAALRRLEGSPVVLEQASLLLVSGRLRAATGDRDRAIEDLERAEAVFTAAGADTRRAACAQELRRLGRRRAPAPRRPGAGQVGPGALTAREREVAELVATGETNRGIGQRLFLSEKTVEAHLRNVFVKLGISSRAAVGRALERE